jgi:hypothetical protein
VTRDLALLSLEFFCGRDPSGSLFVDLVGAATPWAGPRSVGLGDGPGRPVGRRDPGEFVAAWDLARNEEYGARLAWRSASPALGGQVLFRRKDGRDPASVARVRLDFDRDGLIGRAMSSDDLVGAFAALAAGLDAFFGVGVVMRGWHRSGSAIMFRAGRSEEPGLPQGSTWIGLPGSAFWLTWFSEPYAPLVMPDMVGYPITRTGKGIVLRLAQDPASVAELLDADAAPRYPEPLLAHRADSRFRTPPSVPAAFIPDLGIAVHGAGGRAGHRTLRSGHGGEPDEAPGAE